MPVWVSCGSKPFSETWEIRTESEKRRRANLL